MPWVVPRSAAAEEIRSTLHHHRRHPLHHLHRLRPPPAAPSPAPAAPTSSAAAHPTSTLGVERLLTTFRVAGARRARSAGCNRFIRAWCCTEPTRAPLCLRKCGEGTASNQG